jgi:hypothetical protein
MTGRASDRPTAKAAGRDRRRADRLLAQDGPLTVSEEGGAQARETRMSGMGRIVPTAGSFRYPIGAG